VVAAPEEDIVARLDGKVALITGAGGGLGRAMSVRFATEGARVIAHDLDGVTAQATVDAVHAAGGEAIAYACEITDRSAVEAMFETGESAFGPVNVLVSNAGVDVTPDDGIDYAPAQIYELRYEGWRRMLEIHLDGAFHCTQAMVARLVAAGAPGSIVCMSSIAGLTGWGSMHYATAKAGLIGFVKAVARLGGPLGIRANAVCPGFIDTPMTRRVGLEVFDDFLPLVPAGCLGMPDDVAHAALYLASDEAAYVTGETISPNGGFVT
jgi:3-oxoacyl-[acyl-carrier protein] reductase